MILPLLLSVLATLSAAFMAYGVHPGWGRFGWGIGLIMLARRLQWPLIGVSLILCIALLGLVISGKRRAWWLIGLLPVLALFTHRFLTSPVNRYAIADSPPWIAAQEASFVGDDDYVVGVIFNGQAYAYPYACLTQTPVVLQSDRERRLLLIWSARANAATALPVAREVKARELDIVSDPADGLLIYNGRSGQFIAGVTGEMPRGGRPTGVEDPLPIEKVPWRKWKQNQPETRVMPPASGTYRGPTRPLAGRADASQVVLIGHPRPIALLPQHITNIPLNLAAGEVPVVVFRDPGGRVVAFDRHVETDLIPQFRLNNDRRRKNVVFIDSDTNSGWTASGVAVEGDKSIKGKKLARVLVQEDVWETPARFWFGNLTVTTPAAATQPVLGG